MKHEYRHDLRIDEFGPNCKCCLFEVFKSMSFLAAHSAIFIRSACIISTSTGFVYHLGVIGKHDAEKLQFAG